MLPAMEWAGCPSPGERGGTLEGFLGTGGHSEKELEGREHSVGEGGGPEEASETLMFPSVLDKNVNMIFLHDLKLAKEIVFER